MTVNGVDSGPQDTSVRVEGALADAPGKTEVVVTATCQPTQRHSQFGLGGDRGPRASSPHLLVLADVRSNRRQDTVKSLSRHPEHLLELALRQCVHLLQSVTPIPPAANPGASPFVPTTPNTPEFSLTNNPQHLHSQGQVRSPKGA